MISIKLHKKYIKTKNLQFELFRIFEVFKKLFSSLITIPIPSYFQHTSQYLSNIIYHNLEGTWPLDHTEMTFILTDEESD